MNSSAQPTELPHASPSSPAKIGADQKPGEAAEGTVLHSIEAAVKRRVRSHPDTPLKDLYNLVKDFDVVRSTGCDVCPFFLDECRLHYRRRQDGSCGEQSTVPSTAQSDGGSQVPSRNNLQTPATSTGGGQPSTLALHDSPNPIEIILPNGDTKAVRSTKRNGDKSYISPTIVERCNLIPNERRKVLIELRWTIEDGERGRRYRVSNCLFKVKDDLETDLAIGRQVQQQLNNQTGSTENSYGLESSSEDEEMTVGSLWSKTRRHRVTSDPASQVQILISTVHELQETPLLMGTAKTTVTAQIHYQKVRAEHGAVDGETQTMTGFELIVHGITETLFQRSGRFFARI